MSLYLSKGIHTLAIARFPGLADGVSSLFLSEFVSFFDATYDSNSGWVAAILLNPVNDHSLNPGTPLCFLLRSTSGAGMAGEDVGSLTRAIFASARVPL